MTLDQFVEFVKNHWELWLALVVILSLLAVEEFKRKMHGGSTLTAAGMTAMMNHEDVVVLDIRAHAAFQKGHILNAINIQKVDFTLEKIVHYKNRIIIIVDEDGNNSPDISAKIKKDGVEKVYVLGGGITAWRNANLPLIKH